MSATRRALEFDICKTLIQPVALSRSFIESRDLLDCSPRGLAAEPFHEAPLGRTHAPVNRRDRQLGFLCDLFDSPTFSATQPQAASLLVRQSLQKSEQQPHVHLKVRRCFE